MAEAFRLGKIRKILMPALALLGPADRIMIAATTAGAASSA
jgi:hypothetical protein